MELRQHQQQLRGGNRRGGSGRTIVGEKEGEELLLPRYTLVLEPPRVHHKIRVDRFCFSVMVNRNNDAVVSKESERHKTVTLQGI
ncbi:hypothetical protein YC2023_017061 [Brassica napus]